MICFSNTEREAPTIQVSAMSRQLKRWLTIAFIINKGTPYAVLLPQLPLSLRR
jgi:hypothetical protein